MAHATDLASQGEERKEGRRKEGRKEEEEEGEIGEVHKLVHTAEQ